MLDYDKKEIFARNLAYYMEQRKVNRKKVCNDLGLKYSTFSEWLTAKKYPRIDKIEMLASYFGIPKAALIEDFIWHDTPTTRTYKVKIRRIRRNTL